MALDVARLRLVVDSGQVVKATKDLDKLGKESKQTGREVEVLGRKSSKTSAAMASFAKGVAASVISVAALVGLVRGMVRVVNELDAIGKTASKLGLTAEALQELRFAAELSGIEVRTFEMGFQRFTRRAAEAAIGTGEAKDALKQLGIQLRDTNGRLRDSEAVLFDVADAFVKVDSDQERLRLAFKLFDSEGVAFVNLFKDGAAGMREMRAEARELGIVLSNDMVRDAEKMRDEMTKAIGVIDAQWSKFLFTMAKGLNVIFEQINLVDRRLEDQLAGLIEQLRKVQDQQAKISAGGFGLFTSQLGESQVKRLVSEEAELMKLIQLTAGAMEQRDTRSISAPTTPPPITPAAITAAKVTPDDAALLRDIVDSTREYIRLTTELEDPNAPVDSLVTSWEQMQPAIAMAENQFDSFVDGMISGTFNAQDALKGLAAQLTKMAANRLFMMGINALFGSVAPATSPNPAARPTFGHGAAFSAGNVIPFARGGIMGGGIVTGPTLFPMANGAGLMGEAGPEAILPLSRGRDGKLGVQGGGGGSNVIIQITNNSRAQVQDAGTGTGPNGEQIQKLVIDEVGRALGNGEYDKQQNARYGVQPQRIRR